MDGGRADGGPRTRDGRPGKADPPAGKRIHRRRRATRGRAAAAAVMALREGVKNGFGAGGLPPPGGKNPSSRGRRSGDEGGGADLDQELCYHVRIRREAETLDVLDSPKWGIYSA